MRPRPRPKRKGEMNRWEQRYTDRLELLKMSGKVVYYGYEAIRLTLAPGTTYTPDFYVITPDEVQFHEVKGQRFAAGMAKFKIAAELYPWARFIMVEWGKEKEGFQGWKIVMEV